MSGISSISNYNYYPQIQRSANNKTGKLAFTENNSKADTFENDNKKLSTTAKVGLSVLGLGLAALGTVYGIRKYNVKNIKNIQKAFQETFMRDDITVEQAREMMKRYKDIEKIQNREEYAKALFAEAKKNFGFENSPIKLVFEESPSNFNAAGWCKRDNSAICITPECSRKEMLNTMHHEFRHAKQHKYLGTPDTLLKYAEDRVWKMFDDSVLMEMSPIDRAKKIVSDFYKLQADEAPEHLKEWVAKCGEGASNYTLENFDKYWNNFTERDARFAGRTIEKYVRAKAFTLKNWLYDFCLDSFQK